MKKIYIITLVLLNYMLLFSIDVFATSSTSNQMFLDTSKSYQIESHMNSTDQNYYDFMFGTTDVEFDFNCIIPYYLFKNSNSNELTNLLQFSDSYYIPACTSSGEFLGFAEVYKSEQNIDQWEIISVSTGDYYTLFYNVINSDEFKNMTSNSSSIYLVGDFMFNQLGVVLKSDYSRLASTDTYFDFSNYYLDSNKNNPTISILNNKYTISGYNKIQLLQNELSFTEEYGDGFWKVGENEQGEEIWMDDLTSETVIINEEYIDPESDIDGEVGEEIPIEEETEPVDDIRYVDIIYADDGDSRGEGSDTSANPETGSHSSAIAAISATALALSGLFIALKKKK